MNLIYLHINFCGKVIDDADRILAVLPSIDAAGKLFSGYCTVVCEKDSSEQALDIFIGWKEKTGTKITITGKTHTLDKRPGLQFLA